MDGLQATWIIGGALPDAPAGAYKFYRDARGIARAGLNFQCPCGCRKIFGVRFAPSAKGPVWEMSGEPDRLTLSPSVNCLNGDMSSHWHGWLRDGQWLIA